MPDVLQQKAVTALLKCILRTSAEIQGEADSLRVLCLTTQREKKENSKDQSLKADSQGSGIRQSNLSLPTHQQ